MASLKDILAGAAAFGLGVVGYAAYRKMNPQVTPDPNEIVGLPKTLISIDTGTEVIPPEDLIAATEGDSSIAVLPPPAAAPPAAAPSAAAPSAAAMPFPPVGLAVIPEVATSDRWEVSWQLSQDATRYVLQESNDAGVHWRSIYSGPATSFTVTGKPIGIYSYSVTAWNGAVGSGNSEIVSARRVAAPSERRVSDTADLVTLILENDQALQHPTPLDIWVMASMSKLDEEAEVLQVLGLSVGPVSGSV